MAQGESLEVVGMPNPTRWQLEMADATPGPTIVWVLAAGVVAWLLALSLAVPAPTTAPPRGRPATVDAPVCVESARLERVRAPRDATYRRLAGLCRASLQEASAP